MARETENDYRDYTPEDVERLKTIAVLRQLDIPVKTIKEWTDGKVTLRAMIDEAASRAGKKAGSRPCGCRWRKDSVRPLKSSRSGMCRI